MKIKLTLFLVIISFTSIFAQTKKQTENPKFDSWKELKDFHAVIAATFHPAEEGKLGPIKMRAIQLKSKAHILASSKIPAPYNNLKVKALVQKLSEQTTILEKMVADKKSDDEIKTNLSAVHDTFHEIVGLCMGHEHEEMEKHDEKKEQHEEHKK